MKNPLRLYERDHRHLSTLIQRVQDGVTAVGLCANLLAEHNRGLDDSSERELTDQGLAGVEAVLRLASSGSSLALEQIENLTGCASFDYSHSAFKSDATVDEDAT